MIVEALTPDGVQRFRREGSVILSTLDAADEARALGLELGAAVRAEGGPALILTE
jgi:hydroxymethylbilane synthase